MKYKKGFAPIFMLLAIVAVGIVIFLTYENYGFSYRLPTPLSSSSPAALIDTKDWKTYLNPEPYFEFKYPAVFLIKPHYLGASLVPYRLEKTESWLIYSGKEINEDEIFMTFGVDYFKGPSVSEIKEISGFECQYNSNCNVYFEEKKLAGVDSVVVTRNDPPHPLVSYRAYIPTKNHTFIITMEARNLETLEKNHSLYNEILSTFKFTN